ncbi:MAG: hypothetical protein KDE19_22055 [Caldilineaceae bacterium]|nr:hypothetical protein [Caldilineaceae bacterium]
MLEYTLVNGLPSGSRTVWSRLPLQPLAAGPLTPFSYSILEEVARRAWYQYYDELGFGPQPRARVLRQQNGCPYLNLTISAQRDAECAGVEPLTLLLNGERFPVAQGEKSGFLAGIRQGRNRKKIATTLAEYADSIPAVTQKAQSWNAKTKDLRWTQADVLQVMEEIERVAVDSFKIFFATRHQLELSFNQLLWLTNGQKIYPTNIALIGNALGELTGLIEYQVAMEVIALGEMARANEAAMQWLAAAEFHDWYTTIPDRQFNNGVSSFLTKYGHRAASEAEIRHERWENEVHFLFSSLHALALKQPKQPISIPSGQHVQRLLDLAAPSDRKRAQQLLEEIRKLLPLQSQALHAFAYLLAGTRQWAHAAAGEAMADERIGQADDVFFFTLEEVKQMMTGEWNVSDKQKIRRTCAERRKTFAEWEQAMAQDAVPWLLIGDSAAQAVTKGLPAVSGEAIGPLRRWDTAVPAHCKGAIVATNHVDISWSLILPLARALVVAQGTPVEPIVAAARAWHIPAVTTLGEKYHALVDGAQTTVDGERGHVDQ